MKTIIFAITAWLLVACANTSDMLYGAALHQLSAKVQANGDNTFVFVAMNQVPSAYQGMSVDDVHKQWLASDMAEQQFCKNGYQILGKEVVNQNDHTIYTGRCN